jgi:ribonuclease P protein component
MLARTHRFHGYGSLRGVYNRGRTARGPLISLRFASRDPQRPYRVAVVVSRKVHKSAVVRNRIRRRIYEAVRTATEPPQPGSDLVFTVFSDRVAELESATLQAAIDSLLQKTPQQPL